MAYLCQRHEFATLFATYAVSFCAYLMAMKQTKNEADLDMFLKLAIILRGGILFAFPNLSDDIYRFIWDGHLLALGENPFSHLPGYYIENQLFTDVLTPELFAQLNSQNYFSVYPSVCQGVFFVAVSIFPKSIYGACIVIKMFLFLCEIGTLFLLKKMSNVKCQILDVKYQTQNSDTLLLASLAKRRGGSFFGQSPKNEPLFPFFASEASKKEK
ncbi:MAG: hypothetical protein U5L45_01215 [Saprospiraceae bacterium]|nr:hypothetical protein [Saprospiraceae bacterium]